MATTQNKRTNTSNKNTAPKAKTTPKAVVETIVEETIEVTVDETTEEVSPLAEELAAQFEEVLQEIEDATTLTEGNLLSRGTVHEMPVINKDSRKIQLINHQRHFDTPATPQSAGHARLVKVRHAHKPGIAQAPEGRPDVRAQLEAEAYRKANPHLVVVEEIITKPQGGFWTSLKNLFI